MDIKAWMANIVAYLASAFFWLHDAQALSIASAWSGVLLTLSLVYLNFVKAKNHGKNDRE